VFSPALLEFDAIIERCEVALRDAVAPAELDALYQEGASLTFIEANEFLADFDLSDLAVQNSVRVEDPAGRGWAAGGRESGVIGEHQ
jgi:hypothetical protein